jgi:hypothetical protein
MILADGPRSSWRPGGQVEACRELPRSAGFRFGSEREPKLYSRPYWHRKYRKYHSLLIRSRSRRCAFGSYIARNQGHSGWPEQPTAPRRAPRSVQNDATSRGSVTGPRPSEAPEALGFAPDRRAARTARSGRPRRGQSRPSGNPELADGPAVAVQLAGVARRS